MKKSLAVLHDAAAFCLLIPRCCNICIPQFYILSAYFLLMRYDNLYTLCLLIPGCCIMSTYSILLHFVYLFHTAVLFLLILCCCSVSTYYRLLHYVYLVQVDALSLLINAAALCFLILSCCAMPTYIMPLRCAYLGFPMLHCFYIFHTMHIYLALLHSVYLLYAAVVFYLFHTASLC